MRRQQVAKSESELVEGLKKGHPHFSAFLSVESV